MCKINLLIIVLFAATYGNAQEIDKARQKMIDSIRATRIDEAALRYPIIRQFSISHETALAGDISSKLYGKNLFNGNFRTSKTTVNLNMPIISKGKNTIAVGFGAVQQHASLNQVVSYDPQYIVSNLNTDLTTLSTTVSITRQDSLFGLPVTYNLGVTGLFNPSFSRQRITGAALVSFSFIRKENTSLMGGFVGIIDPSSPVPAFLFISYYHRFRSTGIELMINVPSRIAVRKELTQKVSLTAFGDLVGNNFFLDINNSTLPQKAIYSTLAIKSGLMLEYRLTKKAVLSLSGGFQSTVTSKLVENGAKSGDYFINNNNAMVPYVQVGVSLLPFFKLFK